MVMGRSQTKGKDHRKPMMATEDAYSLGKGINSDGGAVCVSIKGNRGPILIVENRTI